MNRKSTPRLDDNRSWNKRLTYLQKSSEMDILKNRALQKNYWEKLYKLRIEERIMMDIHHQASNLKEKCNVLSHSKDTESQTEDEEQSPTIE